MNWQQYKTYLNTKILQEEEDTYLLLPEAKKQYSPTKEAELIQALTNLITSIDNSPYHSSNSYSSLSEQDEEYHSLPELDNLYSESGLITWQQLFPNRSETHFGKKEEIEAEISSATWTILTKIFNDWTHSITRAKKLRDFLQDQQNLLKFISEALINLNYDLIKSKKYDLVVQNWLKEYELLSKEEQEQLKEPYQIMTQLLTSWEEVKKLKGESSWYQKVSWKQVLWYGGGGLLILLVLGYLWKKFND